MGSKRKASAPKKLKEPPLERARSGGNLTLREWVALLADAKAGSLQPTVKGGAPPETSKRRGTADDGTKAAQQYRARFLAWDAGRLQPPEPCDSLPAAELPGAEARRYAGHLSPAEMAAEKSKFIDQARRSAEEAVNLGECEEHSTLLQYAALRAAAWLEQNMPVEYAAELTYTDDDGLGRERVLELHGPVGFIREYMHINDPQFFTCLALSTAESYVVHACFMYKLMVATYATNIESFAELHGLPYVPFRGEFQRAADGMSSFIMTLNGHFQAFYPSALLASEDIGRFYLCETGRGFMQLLKAAGMPQSLTAAVTFHNDLQRVPASTRQLVTGLDGIERSKKTATLYRRGMENKATEEPCGLLATLAHQEHLVRLVFCRGLGARQERVWAYGEPASYYTKRRLFCPPDEQQRLLRDVLDECLQPARVAEIMDANPTLPYVEQEFHVSSHLQNVWANSASIFRVFKQVYQLQGGDLSEEQLKAIKSESNRGMNRDVHVKLARARYDLAVAVQRLAIAAREGRVGLTYSSTPKLTALLAEVKMLRLGVRVANSCSRGGECRLQKRCCVSRVTGMGMGMDIWT